MNIIIQRYRFLGKARFGRLKAEMKCISHKQTNLSDLSSELVCEVRCTDKCFFYLDFHFYFEATGTNFFTRVCRPPDPRAIRALHLRQKLIINLRYTRQINKVTWYLGLLHTYPDIFLIPLFFFADTASVHTA